MMKIKSNKKIILGVLLHFVHVGLFSMQEDFSRERADSLPAFLDDSSSSSSGESADSFAQFKREVVLKKDQNHSPRTIVRQRAARRFIPESAPEAQSRNNPLQSIHAQSESGSSSSSESGVVDLFAHVDGKKNKQEKDDMYEICQQLHRAEEVRNFLRALSFFSRNQSPSDSLSSASSASSSASSAVSSASSAALATSLASLSSASSLQSQSSFFGQDNLGPCATSPVLTVAQNSFSRASSQASDVVEEKGLMVKIMESFGCCRCW